MGDELRDRMAKEAYFVSDEDKVEASSQIRAAIRNRQ